MKPHDHGDLLSLASLKVDWVGGDHNCSRVQTDH